MELQIVNTSIVVVGQQLDPANVHPAWLKLEEIISKDWELLDSPVTTPVLSVVNYTNGYSFYSDTNKFQVLNNDPSEEGDDPQIAQITRGYLQKQPRAQYRDVGVNITGIIVMPDASKFLVGKFLQAGVWNDQLDKLSISFAYPVQGAALSLAMSPGEAQFFHSDALHSGIVVNANYNTKISEQTPLESIAPAIFAANFFRGRYQHFISYVSTIFEL